MAAHAKDIDITDKDDEMSDVENPCYPITPIVRVKSGNQSQIQDPVEDGDIKDELSVHNKINGQADSEFEELTADTSETPHFTMENEISDQNNDTTGETTCHGRRSSEAYADQVADTPDADRVPQLPTPQSHRQLNSQMQQNASVMEQEDPAENAQLICTHEGERTPLLEQRPVTRYSACSIDMPSDLHSETVNDQSDLPNEDDLRKKLWEHLDTPRQRWVKLRWISLYALFQTFKTGVIFLLVWSFGTVAYDHIDFISKTAAALKRLYFRDWHDVQQPYIFYSKPLFYAQTDYLLNQYNRTPEYSIGPYDFMYSDGKHRDSPTMFITYYPKLQLHPANASYTPDNDKETLPFDIRPVSRRNPGTNVTELVYDTKAFLAENNQTIHFDNTNEIKIRLNLTTIHLDSWTSVSSGHKDAIECYNLTVWITYENPNDNGQLAADLSVEAEPNNCNGDSTKDIKSLFGVQTFCCFGVLILCIISQRFVLQRVYKTFKLKTMTKLFFQEIRHINLDDKELQIFVNHWDRMIIVSDLLLIAGCLLQFCLTFLKCSRTNTAFIACTILLGTGCLLSSTSLIRDLDIINENCNIVILALGKALCSRILPFLGCVGLLYVGYLLCGWLVLGPYLDKFSTIPITSETIFSLINGDDVFTTFLQMRYIPTAVHVFGRIYLYTFLIMFIFVIVNVCVSILSDAYDEVMEQGFHKKDAKTVIQKFIAENEELRKERRKPGRLYPVLLKYFWPIKEDQAESDSVENDQATRISVTT